MTDALRQIIRLAMFLGFLGAIALLAGSLKIADLVVRRRVDRTPWAQRCFRGSTWCLGLQITCHGHPSPQPTLYVSNHVSWCDIPVLGGAVPLTFLSKSEVGQWPLIGWLARQAGTLFIKRGSGKVAGIVDQVAARLEGRQSVMIFPEGTTTTGITVLPFHGRLLRAAQQAGTPIQPVSIVYRRNGELDHLAPFINDDDFLGHLCRLLRKSPPAVDILLHPPLEVTGQETPSELAATLRATVLEGVNTIQSGAVDDRARDIIPADSRRLFPRLWPRASR